MRRCVLLNVTDCITLLGLYRSPQEVNKPIHPFVKYDVDSFSDVSSQDVSSLAVSSQNVRSLAIKGRPTEAAKPKLVLFFSAKYFPQSKASYTVELVLLYIEAS